MKLVPLGGAREVGASCYLLDIAGARLLIDAGIRVGSGSRSQSPLPNFDGIGRAPDACLITHAHTDHTGSLPLLVEHIGDSLIHTSVGTLHVTEVLHADALRHLNSDERDGEAPTSFDAAQVERATARIESHPFYERFFPVAGREDISVELIPCGHILGAAAMVIDTPEGRVLWMGDYSVTPQSTIGGLRISDIEERAKERSFTLLVTEGTYGTSTHPPRSEERSKFLSRLEAVAGGGGKTLIPAFAVGRAQDILHDIRQHKLAGGLRNVPVYIDGMVQSVTSIYENLAETLYPDMDGALRLLDHDEGIFKANGQSRSKLMSGEMKGPAIVIASSGMLVGGRSVGYAHAFAHNPRNAILISGYQDEESPGRALLGLRHGKRLRLGDEHVRMNCQIGRYHTSAHADGSEIQAVIAAARPKKVAIVHGAPSALHALQRRIGRKRAVVLRNNRPLYVGRKGHWTRPARTPALPAAGSGVRREAAPSESDVRALWEVLAGESYREYSETEIARRVLGPGYSPVEREVLSRTLADHRLYLVGGSRIGQRSYRPREREEVVDMLLDRVQAHQIPLDVGDIVVTSDGSPDLLAACVLSVDGDLVNALIPGSSRRDFRRDWVRCHARLNISDMLQARSVGYAFKWLEDVVREARGLPGPDPADAYFHALTEAGGRVCAESVLPVFFPARAGRYSSAMRLSAALALAGESARRVLRIESDGAFVARPEGEAAARWDGFEKAREARGVTNLLASAEPDDAMGGASRHLIRSGRLAASA